MIQKFWAGGAILLSFFLTSKLNADPRFMRDFLFFALAMISLCLGTRLSFLAILAILAGALWTSSWQRTGFLYQFPMWCAGIIVFEQLRKKPFDERLIKYILGVLAITSSIWGVLNYLKIEPYHLVKSSVIINPDVIMSGPLLNHTLSSVYPALALVFLPWYWAVLCLIGLVLYGSTMSMLAAFIAVAHYILDKKAWLKWWVYPLVGFILFSLLDTSEFFSGQERFQVWEKTFKAFPLMGGGLGYFHDNYQLMFRQDQVFLQEHNEYLAAYTSFGIVGVIVFLYGTFLAIKSRPSKAKSSTIAFLFICMGSFPLHISSLAIIGIMLYTLTIQGENYGFFKLKTA